MFTYEFSTTVTEDGVIVMPSDYTGQFRKGESVHVIVMVREDKIPHPPIQTDELTLLSLDAVIARIKSRPSEPANIMPGDMSSLAYRLAHPVYEPDPDFDATEWDRQWAQIEAEMDAQEEAKFNQRLQDLIRTMSLP